MKKIILINIVLVLSFFFIFEFFLRFLHLSSLRGVSIYYFQDNKNIEGVAFGEKFYTDKYGFRVPKKNYSYNAAKKNIILVGDSFLFGTGVSESETFSGKLRKEKENFNIINTSELGGEINDYYKKIEYLNKNFKKNRFIIFVNFDDINFYQEKGTSNQEKENSFTSLRNIKVVNKINDFFRSKLYSYVWLVGITTDPAKRYYNNILENFKKESSYKQLNDEILEINNFLEDKNIDKIFIITPYSYQMRNKCKETDFFPQKKLLRTFEENKIDFFDFTEIFCQKSKNENLFINFDPTHLSVNGHEVIFQSIKNF